MTVCRRLPQGSHRIRPCGRALTVLRHLRFVEPVVVIFGDATLHLTPLLFQLAARSAAFAESTILRLRYIQGFSPPLLRRVHPPVASVSRLTAIESVERLSSSLRLALRQGIGISFLCPSLFLCCSNQNSRRLSSTSGTSVPFVSAGAKNPQSAG